jgi:steroid delta-isomerase-like uncharacterized protein
MLGLLVFEPVLCECRWTDEPPSTPSLGMLYVRANRCKEVLMADTKQVAAEALEAFNAHDAAGIGATYADEIVFEAPGDVRTEGVEETVGYAMAWLNAFPDAKLTVHDEIYDGEWGVQRFTFNGTHQDTLSGPGGDIPATNRSLAGRGLQMFRVRDGKIVEEHLYFDQVQMLTQLGLMPEAAATA